MKIINHDLVLDSIDKQILDHLVENARKPILEIARNIGASGASVHQRLRKMEKIPEVTSCYYTTADWSLLIQLNCKDNNHLSSLLNGKIQNITGVLRTEINTSVSIN